MAKTNEDLLRRPLYRKSTLKIRTPPSIDMSKSRKVLTYLESMIYPPRS